MKIFEKKLNAIIAEYDKICIAFSGGVDSTLLLKLASNVRPVVAVLIDGAMVKSQEAAEAERFARSLPNVDFVRLPIDVFKIEGFADNQADRCYHCKKYLMSQVLEVARERGCEVVFDGTNVDDLGDYRPGLKAIQELGIESPFVESGMTKKDIYYLSNLLALPTKNKPAAACLASRVHQGIPLTLERLRAVENGEQILEPYGFSQLRLRLVSPDNWQVEIPKADFNRFYEKAEEFIPLLAEAGININPEPREYKMGSMNQRGKNEG